MIRTPDTLSTNWPRSPAASQSEPLRLPAAAVTRKTKARIASFFIEEWLRSRVGVEVREWRCEAVSQRLQEGHNLIFFLICQTEIADGHVFRAWHLRHRPAVDLLRSTG